MTATYSRKAIRSICQMGFVCVFLIMSGVAQAEFISLATDVYAMEGWKGTLHLSGTNPDGTKNIYVDIDYAVYAPAAGGGNFDKSFPGKDPSSGLKYIYAYQLFNTGGASDASIMSFTVGMDGDVYESPANIKNIDNPAPLGVAYSSRSLSGTPAATSAVWNYYVNNIVPAASGNNKSKILLYSSPAAPELDFTTVIGTYGTTTPELNYLPSPSPEPGTLLALFIAALMFVGGRHIRRVF